MRDAYFDEVLNDNSIEAIGVRFAITNLNSCSDREKAIVILKKALLRLDELAIDILPDGSSIGLAFVLQKIAHEEGENPSL